VADPTGKKSGRGAYVHKERECWQQILSGRGRLEHALKVEGAMPADDRAALEQLATTFPPRAVARSAEHDTASAKRATK